MTRQKLGQKSEDLAVQYLRRLSHKILDRNIHSHLGEVDIVSLDRKTVVFTEVRAKSHVQYGLPEETIDEQKQWRIKRTAETYLYRRNLLEREVRFDVITLLWTEKEYSLNYYKDAFR